MNANLTIGISIPIIYISKILGRGGAVFVGEWRKI